MGFASQIFRKFVHSLSRLVTKRRAEPLAPTPEPLSLEQQTEALQKFQIEMSNIDFRHLLRDRRTLSGFLVASGFDVTKAKEMLLAAERWRIEFGVNKLVQSFKFSEDADVQKLYPHYYHKTDKSGRPILIHQIGRLGVDGSRALLEVTSIFRLVQHFIFEQERLVKEVLPAAEEDSGHTVDGVCLILDYSGISWHSHNFFEDYIASIIEIGQKYYPETLGIVFHVKYPFNLRFVQHRFISQMGTRSLEKTVFAPPGVYQKELLKEIDPENLPHFLGGACDCTGDCRS